MRKMTLAVLLTASMVVTQTALADNGTTEHTITTENTVDNPEEGSTDVNLDLTDDSNRALGFDVLVTVPNTMCDFEEDENDTDQLIVTNSISAKGVARKNQILTVGISNTDNKISYEKEEEDDTGFDGVIKLGDGDSSTDQTWTAEELYASCTTLDERPIQVTIQKDDLKDVGTFSGTIDYKILLKTNFDYTTDGIPSAGDSGEFSGYTTPLSKTIITLPETDSDDKDFTTLTSLGAKDNISGVETVIIPFSYTSIGVDAFANASSLEKVIIYTNNTKTEDDKTVQYIDGQENIPEGIEVCYR